MALLFERLTDTGKAEELTQLLHKAYVSNVDLGIHFAASTVTVEEVKHHIETVPTFVIIIDGEIAATTSVRLPWSADPGPYGLPHLGWVSTNPRYQQQGLAKKIINWVIEHYLKDELITPAVSLGTAVEHPWLTQSYEKLGFASTEIVRKYQDHQTRYLVKVLNNQQFDEITNEDLKLLVSKAQRETSK